MGNNIIDLKEDKSFTDIPKWDLFRGNNHKTIRNHYWIKGGSVSFTDHIGKPLSDRLWKDLFCRLCITGLRIYKNDEEQWCDGHFNGYCIVDLNEDETVADIHLYPRIPLCLPEINHPQLLSVLEFLLDKDNKNADTDKIYEDKMREAEEIYDQLTKYLNKKWTIREEDGIGVININLFDVVKIPDNVDFVFDSDLFSKRKNI